MKVVPGVINIFIFIFIYIFSQGIIYQFVYQVCIRENYSPEGTQVTLTNN